MYVCVRVRRCTRMYVCTYARMYICTYMLIPRGFACTYMCAWVYVGASAFVCIVPRLIPGIACGILKIVVGVCLNSHGAYGLFLCRFDVVHIQMDT